jgi:hypothetical protein
MPPLLQHIVALSLVAICLGYAAWQGMRAFSGKRSRVGSCCATGCSATKPTPNGAPAAPKIAYIPISMLSRKGKA